MSNPEPIICSSLDTLKNAMETASSTGVQFFEYIGGKCAVTLRVDDTSVRTYQENGLVVRSGYNPGLFEVLAASGKKVVDLCALQKSTLFFAGEPSPPVPIRDSAARVARLGQHSSVAGEKPRFAITSISKVAPGV